VAYASIDYRLLQELDTEGVIKPLSDSTRCVQFIRYHAEQLNVDPERIILMGGSAGAGTSLWIGFNDDMADPDSDDPVLDLEPAAAPRRP
jgi:acetyl esterase/lipase